MQERNKLIEKIRREKHVIAKGKPFRLNGYAWRGTRFDEHEWTIEFIFDLNYTGILRDMTNQRIKIFDSFESNEAFGDHLEDRNEEFIGLHRTYDTAVDSECESDDEGVRERKGKWDKPCTLPVFSFTHSLFEDYVYNTTGVIITRVEQ